MQSGFQKHCHWSTKKSFPKPFISAEIFILSFHIKGELLRKGYLSLSLQTVFWKLYFSKAFSVKVWSAQFLLNVSPYRLSITWPWNNLSSVVPTEVVWQPPRQIFLLKYGTCCSFSRYLHLVLKNCKKRKQSFSLVSQTRRTQM